MQKKMGISVETALGIFYHSQLYQLISEGISDMHCMSDGYLVEELEIEYNKKTAMEHGISNKGKNSCR